MNEEKKYKYGETVYSRNKKRKTILQRQEVDGLFRNLSIFRNKETGIMKKKKKIRPSFM